MSESYLPRYTERPGEQVFEPPYVAEDVRLHMCFVNADVDRLNDLIDGSLNVALEARSRGAPRFRATGQPIIFMFAEIAKMYSAAEDYLRIVKKQTPRPGAPATLAEALTDHPYVPEVELGIWVPISRLVYGKQEPGFYLPFVFNGTPASVVTGREVYGYPKQLADFDTPPDRSVPLTSVTMKTWHRPGKDPQYTLADLLTLTLETERKSRLADKRWQAAAARSLSLRDIPTLPRIRFRSAQSGADDQPAEEPSWDDFVQDMVKSAPLLFLRQFRDPVNPADATVQQIISARFVIQATPTFSFHPETKSHIEFRESVTLDLIGELGLKADTSAARTVAITSLVVIDNLSFTVDLGKVLG
jgi:hypothetical protein